MTLNALPGQSNGSSASSYKDIVDEILAGFPNHRQVIDSAQRNLRVYQGQFNLAPIVRPETDYQPSRKPRYSRIMKRVVDALTSNLYRTGPKRTLAEHPEATKWLETIYRRNWIDARWQQADRYTLISDTAMFEVKPTTDPRRPLDIRLWDASCFIAWSDPEIPLRPIAVAVRDMYNNQKRVRLWTDVSITTFMTKQWKASDTSSGTSYYQIGQPIENPYGFLPFAWAHVDLPDYDFHVPGPGDSLCALNESISLALTETSDAVEMNLWPILVGKNIREGWQPKKPMRPGSVMFPPSQSAADGEQGEADLDYLQADSSFVSASWDDIHAYIDHSLEMIGVPVATVRMIQDSARSGVSIMAEQAPLVAWAEGRQRPFGIYEEGLAEVVLRMGAAHLGSQDRAELKASARQLLDAADDCQLAIKWPRMYARVPGAEANADDQFLLDSGLSSRTVVVMDRYQMSRPEAREYLEEIAEDLQYEETLFGPIQQAQLDRMKPPETHVAPQEENDESVDPESESDAESNPELEPADAASA